MSHPNTRRAQVLSEGAVYRRTQTGQGELIRLGGERLSMRGRILARVNGYTHLQGLIDLSPGDVDEIGNAILELLDSRLIERIEG